MSVLFGAAQLSGLLPGNFGKKDDAEARAAHAQLTETLASPDFKTLIDNASDSMRISFDVDGDYRDNRQLTIRTSMQNPWLQVPGVRSFRIALAEIIAKKDEILAKLKSNAALIGDAEALNTRLTKLAEECGFAGLDLKTFAPNKALGSNEQIAGEKGMQVAKALADVLEDPEVHAALAQNIDYKWNQLNVRTADHDIDKFLASKGVDPEKWVDSSAGQEAHNKAMEGFEMKIPEEIGIRFSFTNMNFTFDAEEGRYSDAKSPAFKNGQITIKVKDLLERPAKVKSQILKAATFWNQELAKVL